MLAFLPARCSCFFQTRAELDAAEASVAALTADKLQLQQELSSSRDKVMLLESELKLKVSRMEAAQQQLASEGQEHQAKQALLQKQLEQLKVTGHTLACIHVLHGCTKCQAVTDTSFCLGGLYASALAETAIQRKVATTVLGHVCACCLLNGCS